MRTSEQTDKIDEALGRVQAELDMAQRNKGVEVEGKTTKFATKYVTIGALYELCRELLTREQITIWQGGHFEQGGGERLITRLAHAGQWIESSFPVKAREGAQNFGGGVAFARRWGLACAVGIFPQDDPDEKHGYEVSRADQKAAKRSAAPSGIGEALEGIRKAPSVEALENVAARARGAFPTGEAAGAVEKEIAGWYIGSLDQASTGEDVLSLRASLNAVRLKASAADVRAAIQRAEQRVKGAAS